MMKRYSLFMLLSALAFAPIVSAKDHCSPIGGSKGIKRFQISEKQLSAATLLFNSLGTDIRADQVPASLTMAKEQKQGYWTYFDTPEQSLKHLNHSLLLDENLRFNERTPLSIKLDQQLDTVQTYEAKAYRRILDREDKHSLIGRVKRSEREQFITQLKDLGIDNPVALKPVLPLTYIQNSFLLKRYSNTVLRVSFNSIESKAFGIPLYIHELEIADSGCDTSILSNDEKEFIHFFYSQLDRNIRETGAATETNTSPYDRYWEAGLNTFPLLAKATQYPLLFSISQGLALALIGGLFLTLVLRRRDK